MLKTTPPSAADLRFAVLATDVVVCSIIDNVLSVRLVPVHRPPFFVNQAGVPGGLVGPRETAEDAARRVVAEKGLLDPKKLHLEQLYTFSRVDRDPRGRVVAVAYIALVPHDQLSATEQSNTDQAYWTPLAKAKKLAFDHDEILQVALARLRSRTRYTTLIAKLMPRLFTLTELEGVFEAIIGTELDKRNFRKKILKLGILEETGEKRASGAFRPAALYRFTSTKVQDIEVL